MAAERVTIVIFFLTNAVDYIAASPKSQSSDLNPWYCHRLVPAFITSAVTPCTYPCLFLSAYEQPHIVVHPEPNGTPCRIQSSLNHHFKVGKCSGSVCRSASPHATLKRKKRFVCLYALVKLIKAKKQLAQLKAAIAKLESEAAAGSALGGRGDGYSGLTPSGTGAGGVLNFGNRGRGFSGTALVESGGSGQPGIGNSLSSPEVNLRIANSRMGGGTISSPLLDTPSTGIGETGGVRRTSGNTRAVGTDTSTENILAGLGLLSSGGSNAETGRAPDSTSNVGGSASIGNRGASRTTILGSGVGRPSNNNFGSPYRGSMGIDNAGAMGAANSPFLSGSNNGGSGLRVVGIGSTNSGPPGLSISDGGNIASASDNSGLRIGVNGALSINGNTGSNGESGGRSMRVSLRASSTTDNGIRGSMSPGDTASFSSGLGGNNIGDTDVGSTGGTNLDSLNLARAGVINA